MMRFDALIFDIDNVLIDTRGSYTDCIRETVASYLVTKLGFQPSRRPLLSRLDVETFKSLGGFNDDWDTCSGLLLYLLSLKPRRRTIYELAAQKNIERFAGSIKTRPLGVKGVEKMLGRANEVNPEKISEMFQRFFLGEFVWKESPLIKPSILRRFKRAGLKLGIVTGRNREEAAFSLRRFKMDGFIDAMVTQDETPKRLKKPNPYGLLKIAAALGKTLRFLYVGDLPDDMMAAARAAQKINISACGYLEAAANRSEMKRLLKASGAKYICETPRELENLILGP